MNPDSCPTPSPRGMWDLKDENNFTSCPDQSTMPVWPQGARHRQAWAEESTSQCIIQPQPWTSGPCPASPLPLGLACFSADLSFSICNKVITGFLCSLWTLPLQERPSRSFSSNFCLRVGSHPNSLRHRTIKSPGNLCHYMREGLDGHSPSAPTADPPQQLCPEREGTSHPHLSSPSLSVGDSVSFSC